MPLYSTRTIFTIAEINIRPTTRTHAYPNINKIKKNVDMIVIATFLSGLSGLISDCIKSSFCLKKRLLSSPYNGMLYLSYVCWEKLVRASSMVYYIGILIKMLEIEKTKYKVHHSS
jgi:hypothetical protein